MCEGCSCFYDVGSKFIVKAVSCSLQCRQLGGTKTQAPQGRERGREREVNRFMNIYTYYIYVHMKV